MIGYWANLLVWGNFSLVYFMVYESIKARRAKFFPRFCHANDSVIELAAGTIGGAAGAIVTQPLDCLKTRMLVGQTTVSPALRKSPRKTTATRRPAKGSDGPRQWGGSTVTPKGMMDLFVNTCRQRGGVEGLFRGTAARVFCLAPSSGLLIAAFEAVQ